MSALGEWVLKRIVSHGRRDSHAPADINKDYIKWQFDSTRLLLQQFPFRDFAGKRVLEIGCGTGGRTAFMATCGAELVVGIDINAAEIGIAESLCRDIFPQASNNTQYFCSKENEPLDIGLFDVVLMIDTLEHVQSPASMLRLAKQYLKPGGHLMSGFQGFYNKDGSHMGMMPFVNVIFSDETILNVARWLVTRSDYQRHRFDSDPPLARWIGIYDLRDRPGEYLNKITIRQAKKLVKYCDYASASLYIVGLGSRRRWLKPLNVLSRVPLLQEMFHSYVVVHCIR